MTFDPRSGDWLDVQEEPEPPEEPRPTPSWYESAAEDVFRLLARRRPVRHSWWRRLLSRSWRKRK